MFLLFKNYSLVEVIYLLIRLKFLWNTNSTDRRKTNHTHQSTPRTERKITLESVC